MENIVFVLTSYICWHLQSFLSTFRVHCIISSEIYIFFFSSLTTVLSFKDKPSDLLHADKAHSMLNGRGLYSLPACTCLVMSYTAWWPGSTARETLILCLFLVVLSPSPLTVDVDKYLRGNVVKKKNKRKFEKPRDFLLLNLLEWNGWTISS